MTLYCVLPQLTYCTVSAACSAGARAGDCAGVDGHRLLVGASECEGIFILLKVTNDCLSLYVVAKFWQN